MINLGFMKIAKRSLIIATHCFIIKSSKALSSIGTNNRFVRNYKIYPLRKADNLSSRYHTHVKIDTHCFRHNRNS